jgi:hypothetical protein
MNYKPFNKYLFDTERQGGKNRNKHLPTYDLSLPTYYLSMTLVGIRIEGNNNAWIEKLL